MYFFQWERTENWALSRLGKWLWQQKEIFHIVFWKPLNCFTNTIYSIFTQFIQYIHLHTKAIYLLSEWQKTKNSILLFYRLCQDWESGLGKRRKFSYVFFGNPSTVSNAYIYIQKPFIYYTNRSKLSLMLIITKTFW